MLIIRTFSFLFIQICFSSQLVDHNIVVCVRDIILENFEYKSQITFLDGDNDKILPSIYQMQYVTVQLLTARRIGIPFNTEYLILANDCKDFDAKIQRITIGITWNANAKFLVIFKDINDTRCIFDVLLKKHIVNAVVVNDTASLELLTYNPYEDFACGKRYNRVIKLGYCKGKKIFDNKIVTGLRKCTFQALTAHMPPYSIDPATNQTYYQGIEQYVLSVLAHKEGFKIDFKYEMDIDDFTVIADNMSAVGPMSALQNGEADIIHGALLLNYERAKVFEYLTGGISFTDNLQLHVSKAKPVSNFQNIYASFQNVVWLSLLSVFAVYTMLMYIITRNQPQQGIILKMFGFFLQQSSRIKGDTANRVFIFWIFFAYLINCYYHSSIIGAVIHPRLNYQISSYDDIVEYNLEPCISFNMRTISSSENYIPIKKNGLNCELQNESLKKVAESNNHFTVYLKSLYLYEEDQYFDDYGKSQIYTINNPTANILYAIYFYKGFPLRAELQHLCRRIDAAGLIVRYYKRLEREKNVRRIYVHERKYHFFIPWYVLGFGVPLSTFVFALELAIHKYISRH